MACCWIPSRICVGVSVGRSKQAYGRIPKKDPGIRFRSRNPVSYAAVSLYKPFGRPIDSTRIPFSHPGLRSHCRERCWSRSETAVLAGDRVGPGVCKLLPTPTPDRSSQTISCQQTIILKERLSDPTKTLKYRKKISVAAHV